MGNDTWSTAIVERLLKDINRDGGWGYRPGLASCAEATALVCIALADRSAFARHCQTGLRWLAGRQDADGGVPNTCAPDSPAWTTGLAVLAWALAGRIDETPHQSQSNEAIRWLTRARGRPVAGNREVFGHDTTLVGWSWVEGTHSWVEPTAYAVLAMRTAGQGDHARMREGITLLLDRTIPGGGWNYGNTKVLGNTLRPFPATTGLVLCALAGEPRDDRINESLAYLRDALPSIRSPLSLAWGLMGLSAWNQRPGGAAQWLEECAERCLTRTAMAMENALLLLATADTPVLGGALTDVNG